MSARDEQALAWANANPKHPEAARVKEKAMAALQQSTQPPTPESPDPQMAIEGLRPQGSNPAMQGLSAALQSLGLTPESNPLKAAANMATGPTKVGQTFNEGSEVIGGNTAEFLGSKGVPAPVSATGGMLAQILSNPLSYVAGPESKVNVRLGRAPSEGSMGARFNSMRTGVDAQSFDRLRRDPSAFFAKPTSETGPKIGTAKANSGINLGVRPDKIETLTPENISKARTPNIAGKKALDEIMESISEGRKPTPDAVSTALQNSNTRLSKLNPGTDPYFQETAIKSNLQNLLEQVAPEVKAANKDYSRSALREEFMQPFPVNQNGAFSKINAFGFAPAMAVAGGSVAGGPGAILAAILAQAARSPYVAGATTAARGGLDKLIDPLINATASAASKRLPLANNIVPKKKDGKQK